MEKLCNLKPIELKPTGAAEFELEMSLKDTNSKIFLFKVGAYILTVTLSSNVIKEISYKETLVTHNSRIHIDKVNGNLCLNRME